MFMRYPTASSSWLSYGVEMNLEAQHPSLPCRFYPRRGNTGVLWYKLQWPNQKTWINKKYLLSGYHHWEVAQFCDSCSCQTKSHSGRPRQHDSNLVACLQAPWRKEEPVEFKKRESTFHLLFLKIIETNEGGTSCHLPLYVGIDTTLKRLL